MVPLPIGQPLKGLSQQRKIVSALMWALQGFSGPLQTQKNVKQMKARSQQSRRTPKAPNQGTPIDKIQRNTNPISSLPVDSEWYESYTQISITHAASPNTLAFRQVLNISGSVNSVGDEEVYVYDRYTLIGNLTSGNGAYPQDWHFVTLKGPSTATFSSSDAAPTSGFKTQVDAAVSGGTEIKRFQVNTSIPTRRSGSWLQDTAFQVDLTADVNAFIDEKERTISQGRTGGKYELWLQTNGTNASTSILNFKIVSAFHTRRRKVVL